MVEPGPANSGLNGSGDCGSGGSPAGSCPRGSGQAKMGYYSRKMKSLGFQVRKTNMAVPVTDRESGKLTSESVSSSVKWEW